MPDTGWMRLQRFLAAAGLGSRRACEQLILDGAVSVNGVVVRTLGTRVDPARDCVSYQGKPVRLQPHVYVALHKPAGYLCSRHDPHHTRTVFDLLPPQFRSLHPVGRLDKDSEGLLLLTNDGAFSLRLTHPRYKIPKRYQVLVAGMVSEEALRQLEEGVLSEGERLKADRVRRRNWTGQSTELEIWLTQGRKRQIRRMLQAVGYRVIRLVRVGIGPLSLRDLEAGQWRFLSDEEVQQLLDFPTVPNACAWRAPLVADESCG
ncbi:MAG: rRNA pseudouridine synthase [Verrucomicrobiae bacterium]|nr:rRNA pseudouridine synthase [Verrucomicrobiae bacterium]